MFMQTANYLVASSVSFAFYSNQSTIIIIQNFIFMES